MRGDVNTDIFADMWAAVIEKYPDRFMIGSDKVGHWADYPHEIECPPDVNGFEYEIRESSRCVREGRSHSDIFKPEDSVAVLRLLDEVRESWNMRFAFED